MAWHVFAVSGSNITGPPIYSPITDSGGNASADATTQPITVPADSLLLGWIFSAYGWSATAQSGFTLNAQSGNYLAAESESVLSAGAYSGHFSFATPVGWQTGVVGLKPGTVGPAAENQAVTTSPEGVNITLVAVSPTQGSLTYTVAAPPTHGTLSGVAPYLTYTPAAGYAGADSFTFKANDGTGDSNVATVSITDLPPDQPPVASNGTATVPAGATAAITLTASDPYGNPLTYAIITAPAHGQLSGGGPSQTYTPAAGYVGGDSFTFKANDGFADSNVAQVTITVVAAPPPTPVVVSSREYINGTPLTTHTTAAFNSIGGSTMVAFVSSFPVVNGLPVSIAGVSDNLGNTWSVLTGPTTYAVEALMSGLYYVNAPVTSAAHTVTVTLTNGAPLVVHVFAVSGSDITGPPIYSPITDSGGNASADVTSQPITVPADSLLLGWVFSANGFKASAAGGFTLDAESGDYLAGEAETVFTAGAYTGHFSYATPVGWQTAVVAVKPR